MKISAIVRALVSAGATPDMILAAVEAAEADAVDGLERRRASDRERQQRRRHVTSRDVTVTERDTPISDKEKSPTPPKEINSSPTSLRSENKRACRLPADFEPDWEFAAGQGLDRSQAEVEFAKFRDFWNAKGGKDAAKLDWPATWRNWTRNAAKPRAGQQGPPRVSAQQERQQAAIKAFDQYRGPKPDDDFTGKTLDLGERDFRADRAASAGR